MLKFAFLLVPIAYAALSFKLSAWNLRRKIRRNSTKMRDREFLGIVAEFERLAGFSIKEPRIYEIEPVNGLVTPDGQVYVTRGMFDRYRGGRITAPELASVVAHEMGHVAHGHARQRATDFTGQNMARAALGFLISRYIPFVGGFVADAIMLLFSRKMSRRDELEADEYASALMLKSGMGTAPQKSLLRKLEQQGGTSGGSVAWLMSHPKASERIRAIEERETRWKGRPDSGGH